MRLRPLKKECREEEKDYHVEPMAAVGVPVDSDSRPFLAVNGLPRKRLFTVIGCFAGSPSHSAFSHRAKETSPSMPVEYR